MPLSKQSSETSRDDVLRSKSSRHGMIIKTIVAILAATSITIPVVTFAVAEKFPVVPEEGFAVVKRGSMELVVTQSGEVDSADNDVIISQCEWSTRVISLIPEGTWVEKGDIIAELDSSSIKKRFQDRAVLLVNAAARLADAQEDLRIQKLTNESILARAELQQRLSKLQLDGYVEAEHPQKLNQLKASVALAEEELNRGEKQFEFVEDMVRLGYRTQSERDRERINVLKQKQALQLATDKLNVLQDFSYDRNLTRLKAIAVEAERELERVKMASSASILRREITVRSRERSYRIYKDYQDRLEKNIAACTVRASRSGELIYARKSSRSTSRIDEGSSMRYLQPIAKIPDRDRLQVKLRLHESNIRLMRTGLPAIIEIDAAGQDRYQGHISHLSTVPLAGLYPNYHLREYRVTVDVDVDPELARTIAPGMTAKVNIIAEQRQSTLQAPVQSIVEVGGEHIVFVRHGNEVEHRNVEVGISSDNEIEILNGLEEGEEIVLKPRVTCAQRIIALQKQSTGTEEERFWLSMTD